MKLRTAVGPLLAAGTLTIGLAGPAAATTANAWSVSPAAAGTTRYYGTWTQSASSTLVVTVGLRCGGGTVTVTPERKVSSGWTTQAAARMDCASGSSYPAKWSQRPAGTYRLRVDFHSAVTSTGAISVNE